MGIGITAANFSDGSYPTVSVAKTYADQGAHRRFHLLFAYVTARGTVASGDQVVMAEDLAQAAVRIAEERGVAQLIVRKRYFSNKPAADAEVVDTLYEVSK